MGEGYNTGDDSIFEVLGAVSIAVMLCTNQNYLNMFPFPPHWAAALTIAVSMVIPIISQGRLFWAFVSGSAWILMKTGIVKPDETELIIEYDETGWPIKIEEKEKESQDNQEVRK